MPQNYKKNGELQPCIKWNFQFRKQKFPSHELFSTNGAGTLFPQNSLPKIAFNKELLKRLCLNADDIWLKFMFLLNEIPVVYARSMNPMPFIITTSQKITLSFFNVAQSKNDEYIKALEDYFNIELSNFAHETN